MNYSQNVFIRKNYLIKGQEYYYGQTTRQQGIASWHNS